MSLKISEKMYKVMRGSGDGCSEFGSEAVAKFDLDCKN